MKKTLVAIAALAAVSAFAQSTVTLSGTIAYGYQQDTTAAKNKGFTNTDMGFTLSAVEDLGGGMAAFANATYDTTGSTFASTVLRRNSAIGLRGGFGQVSIGNTRSSDLLTRAWVAPSSLPDGIYDSNAAMFTRAPIDVITYATKFDAFTPSISYVESGADGNTTPATKTTVLQLDYANGPLAAGVSYKMTTGLAAGIEKNNLEMAATYDLGVAKLGVGYDGKRAGTAKGTDKAAFALGVAVPFGATVVGVNWAKRGAAKATEFAAQYNLSKRTFVNFSAGKQNADVSSQYRIKLQHNF